MRIKTPTLESCCKDYMSFSWPQIIITIITVESEAFSPSPFIQLFFKSWHELFILLDHVIANELRKMLFELRKCRGGCVSGPHQRLVLVEYSLLLGLVGTSWWDQPEYHRQGANATAELAGYLSLVTLAGWMWGYWSTHFSEGMSPCLDRTR